MGYLFNSNTIKRVYWLSFIPLVKGYLLGMLEAQPNAYSSI